MVIDGELDFAEEINKNLKFAVVTVLFVVLKLTGFLILNWWFVIVAIGIDIYLTAQGGINFEIGAKLHNHHLVKAGVLKEAYDSIGLNSKND